MGRIVAALSGAPHQKKLNIVTNAPFFNSLFWKQHDRSRVKIFF
jgi:hypothetical protein